MGIQRTFAILLVSGFAVLAVWWQWPTAKAPRKIPLIHRPASYMADEAYAPTTLRTPPAEVELSIVPAVAADVLTPSPPTAFDARADLSTTIPDILHLLQAGDYVFMFEKYIPADPGIDEFDKSVIGEGIGNGMKTEAGQKEVQSMISEIQFIQNSPPAFTDDGNRATYALPAGSKDQNIVFIKIKGLWYREDWRIGQFAVNQFGELN